MENSEEKNGKCTFVNRSSTNCVTVYDNEKRRYTERCTSTREKLRSCLGREPEVIESHTETFERDPALRHYPRGSSPNVGFPFDAPGDHLIGHLLEDFFKRAEQGDDEHDDIDASRFPIQPPSNTPEGRREGGGGGLGGEQRGPAGQGEEGGPRSFLEAVGTAARFMEAIGKALEKMEQGAGKVKSPERSPAGGAKGEAAADATYHDV